MGGKSAPGIRRGEVEVLTNWQPCYPRRCRSLQISQPLYKQTVGKQSSKDMCFINKPLKAARPRQERQRHGSQS